MTAGSPARSGAGPRPARGARRHPRPEAPRDQGPDDPDRRPPRGGPSGGEEGAHQGGRGRADAGRQGGLGPPPPGRGPDRRDDRRRDQRRAGAGGGRRRAGAGRRRLRHRRRGRLDRPDGRPARAAPRRHPPGPADGRGSSARTSSFFAFGLNGLAVLLAGLRVLGPVAAAIFHQVGSLLVLLNAMRLLGFERWAELPGVRAAGRAIEVCRTCRPSTAGRLGVASPPGSPRPDLAVLLVLAYLASGIVLIDPGQVGVLQRWGRYQPPLLGPGLHVRWPSPCEAVTIVEPDAVRVARVGLAGPSSASSTPESDRLERDPRRRRRDESAPVPHRRRGRWSSWPRSSSIATPRPASPRCSSAPRRSSPSSSRRPRASSARRSAGRRWSRSSSPAASTFEREVEAVAPGPTVGDRPARGGRPGPRRRRPPAPRGRPGLSRRLGRGLRRRALSQRRRGVRRRARMGIDGRGAIRPRVGPDRGPPAREPRRRRQPRLPRPRSRPTRPSPT